MESESQSFQVKVVDEVVTFKYGTAGGDAMEFIKCNLHTVGGFQNSSGAFMTHGVLFTPDETYTFVVWKLPSFQIWSTFLQCWSSTSENEEHQHPQPPAGDHSSQMTKKDK
jgi:hypothetical protein